MKDTIVKTITLLLGFALLTYIARLLGNNVQVTLEDGGTNLLVLICCVAVAGYLIAMNFFPAWIPNNRWGLPVAGVMIIVVASAIIVDNPSQQVYIGDIMKLIGVFFIIAGLTKLLVSKKVKARKEKKGVEIIEV